MITKVVSEIGAFYQTCGKVAQALLVRPFPRREYVEQSWFIASVSLLPTLMMSVPFCVILVFQLNQLLGEIGATDLAGAGTGLAVVREIGPMVTVLIVAGAGATAVCADLGARKIREEIDALEVMGLRPMHRLVLPRVLASMTVALALNGVVTLVGLTGGFLFSVFLQNASPGLFVSNLTLLTGLRDLGISSVKAATFGLLAGLVACHLGVRASGGPKGVGSAVNQTVVFSFILLFLANSIITALFLEKG